MVGYFPEVGAEIAQLAEHLIRNQEVGSSILPFGTKVIVRKRLLRGGFFTERRKCLRKFWF